MNDPRPNHSYGKLYTVDYLGNMTGGRPVLYINQPIEVLKKVTIASLKDDEVFYVLNKYSNYIVDLVLFNVAIHYRKL